MASFYTHERFGRHLLAGGVLPEILEPYASSLAATDAARETSRETPPERWREAFLWGQQGPDPFFYHPLLKPRALGTNPGLYIHRRSGYDYIRRGGKKIRTCAVHDPDLAYFLGTICHFILDIHIHPLVDDLETPAYRHMDIEGELDRHYMLADGRDPWNFPLADLVPDRDAVAYMEPVYQS